MATPKEVNVFLTEAMGICFWIDHTCPKCKDKPVSRRPSAIDFSTWAGFGVLWDWASEQKWWSFANSQQKKGFIEALPSSYYDWCVPQQYINPSEFATAIYAFLKEQK